MKLLGTLSVALVAAQNKKVPPKTPEQRLNTLKGFFAKFTADIMSSVTGDGVATRFNSRMQRMLENMEAAYNRPNCGYFDPSSKHGGPDPYPGFKNSDPNGKKRNRRLAEEDSNNLQEQACTGSVTDEDGNVETYDPFGDMLGNCCSFDWFNEANSVTCQKGERAGGKKKGKDQWSRLSDDPKLKWKQITTGTRKWAERYINNCSGQRKNKLVVKRMKKVYAKINTKMGW